MNTEVKKPMSRKKIVWISVASVLAVVAVVIVVLACVRVSPQPVKGGLKADTISSVQVISDGSYNWSGDGTQDKVDLELTDLTADNALKNFVDAYNKASNYSVGYGILNNVWSNKVKAVEDELDIAAVKSIQGTADYPLVVVKFDQKQKAMVLKESIEFDYLFFHIHDTSNTLKRFAFYLIDGDKIGSSDVEDVNEDYEIKEYNGWMNGSRLTDFVADFKD